MKKIKLGFWLIIVVLLVSIVYQNLEYFKTKPSLDLDLIVAKYYIVDISNGIFFLASFLAGLLIAYTFGLLAQFRARKTIKNLNATINSQIEMITSLKQQAVQQTPVAATATSADAPSADGPGEAAI